MQFRAAISVFAISAPPLLAAPLAGCSGGGGDINPVSGGTRLEAGPFRVAAGEEKVMCSFVRLDNAQAASVMRLIGRQTRGGHHLIVYTVDHPIDSDPVACSQGGQPSWTQIMVTQIHEETLEMPEGVGFHLAPHQQFVLETHFINTSSESLAVSSSVEIEVAPEGSVKERAAPFYFGTTNIDIAPGSALAAGSTCSPPDDIHLFRMFGHQHRHGTGVRVESGPRDGTLDELYRSSDWEAPPVEKVDLTVGPDSAVRVTCDWNNTSTERLFYPDEMCFAVGMYWPARGQLFCATTGLGNECKCSYSGNADAGPGGAEARLLVGRKQDIPGMKGLASAGNPIYCGLYRPEDWGASGPEPGKRPLYSSNVGHVPLATESDRAEIWLRDVTPGEYRVFCYMDTVGGGITPGPGVPGGVGAEPVVLTAGESRTVELTLDEALQ